jgi:hypothetical protein
VAGGATADELDRDLRPAVRRLVSPLMQNRLSDQRQAATETVRVERRLPGTTAAIWVVAGYAWDTFSLAPDRSGFGWDLGGHLFFRVAGPLYLGGLVDYSLSGPNALLVAGGARVALPPVALSAGAGYASLGDGGVGVIGAADIDILSGFSFRLQGSWRRATGFIANLTPGQSNTVVSAMGGLSLQF